MKPESLNFSTKEEFDNYKTKVGISNMDIFAPELVGEFDGIEVYVGINQNKKAFLVLPDITDEDGDKSNTRRYLSNRDTTIFNKYKAYKPVSDKIEEMEKVVSMMGPIEYHVNLSKYKEIYKISRERQQAAERKQVLDINETNLRQPASLATRLPPGAGGGKKSRRKKSRKSKRRKRNTKKKKSYKRRR